jgi:hypothetical protein
MEQQLLSLRIPFCKMLSLYGVQRGIQGAINNVPADVQNTLKRISIPNTFDNGGFIEVQLKMRKAVKSNQTARLIHKDRLLAAARYLTDGRNRHYRDIVVNPNFDADIPEQLMSQQPAAATQQPRRSAPSPPPTDTDATEEDVDDGGSDVLFAPVAGPVNLVTPAFMGNAVAPNDDDPNLHAGYSVVIIRDRRPA